MRNLIKKPICIILVFIMVMSMTFLPATAAAGRTSIACSNSNPKVGETVTVTVSFTTAEAMLAASGTLSYTSEVLQFVSGNNANNTAAGTVELVSSQQNVTSASFSVTFTVLSAGSASLMLSNCIVADLEKEEEVTGSSVNIVALSGNEGVPSQSTSSSSSEVELSSNADLKSITVAAGTLTPAFSKDVTEYTVTVPYDKTDGILSCKVADGNARLAFGGSRELNVGLTKRTITVTAQDGTKKVYTVTFNRLDEKGRDTTSPDSQPDNNIEITYNGVKHFLTSDFAEVTLPAGFSVDVFKYGEEEVSCIKDASGKLTVLCLIPEGSEEKKFFLYDNEKGFSEFNYIEVNGATYVIMGNEDDIALPKGYTKTTYEALPLVLHGYVSQAQKDYVVVSAMAPDGTIGFYRYDIVQKTFQRYPEFTVDEAVEVVGDDDLPSSRKITVIILMLLAVELVIAIIVIAIVLIVKSIKKRNSQNDEISDYDIDEDSQEADFEDGVESNWIKSPDEDDQDQ